MIYATAARGFRSGGFNPPSPDFPEIYSPERTTGVELGAKTSAFGNRITFNIAGFFTEYDNQHVFILKLANQGIVNIAKSEILGFEAELKARPVTGLQLAASLGLLDTKIKNFDSSALYRGNQIPLTYGWSYALSGQYKVPIGQWSLTPRVEYTARGDNFWHVDNDDKQEDLHLVDIRLTAEFGDISVYGYANNVFDKKYTEEFFAQQFSGLFSDIRYPGTPRRYGVGATIRF
jgi:iron complex outermembrane receptor protein